MAVPERRDLTARRNTPFMIEWGDFVDEVTGAPIDFTGRSVRMQVRQYGAQPGEALIELEEVGTPITEGIIASDDTLQIFIDEASLRTLPQGKPGAAITFAYDLTVDAEVWVEGAFVVKHGSTDRLGLRVTETGDIRITEDGRVRVTE